MRGEHRGNTDGGVARYRRMLRQAIRRLQDGIEPARPQMNEDGHIPTMAGDVIVHCPGSDADHRGLAEAVCQSGWPDCV